MANNGQTWGRDYYSTIDELANSSIDGSKHLTDKLTKDSMLCLLKSSIGHLSEAKVNLSIIFPFRKKIESFKREKVKLVENVEKMNADLPKSGETSQTYATPINKVEEAQ